jgi:hypothetical protein
VTSGGAIGRGGQTESGGAIGSGGAGAGGRAGSGGVIGAGGTLAGGSGGTSSPDAATTGTGGTQTGGTIGTGGTGTGGATGTGGNGCANTNTSVINEDSSGYICNNMWGIKGAWYCYGDGSDASSSCKGSDGFGTGAIPWNASSSAMCLSGTMGAGSSGYAGIGFEVNSGPPGSTGTPGTWDASNIVGFAITLTSGASGKGTGGMILNLEYPTSTDLDSQTRDAPGITIPGVGSSQITYNALLRFRACQQQAPKTPRGSSQPHRRQDRLFLRHHLACLRLLHNQHRAADVRSESSRGHGRVRATLEQPDGPSRERH